MDQEEQECISTIALREVLGVLAPYVDRVTRIDVSDSRVSVEFVGATPKSESKPEEKKTNEQIIRELLPGAVLPERPRR